ncbi:bifunctional 4-hydroxy-2-oxoglutarate aldolase/2-dehydro-3-deoxy-phosphogluconate aldolase [Cyanobium sp. NS01]|uniref:bifunctional 4-hydroxy-2-oxoglutarate aldolase/2-dehydro-3-deoxy-phosphogluconate aldolase n=1 Tax=Cyanobium sp. NS01 TaxID=261284 RepID=UPI0018630116|nr:bifunctional 4-hydroxy-2-oxoglutarate aldolase/2-dehydro-3-deoxy-phosphogluconate aldolase [Cyanobium sp. NS01]QNI71729.1 2-keto-3-deoxy-6-phosphogluconate aldolase [Cyanobium sp. NS01]
MIAIASFPPFLDALRRQPLLVVLRAEQPRQLEPALAALDAMGLVHVEISWQPHPDWAIQCRALQQAHPRLRLGAASLCSPEAIRATAAAGLGYGVSPVLIPELWHEACRLDLALVPGVFTPTEVMQARQLGCPAVKLFPAASLGSHYWSRLRGPLGALPFCIAAGGLAPHDVRPWLQAGVDAVALGGSLDRSGAMAELKALISELRSR